MFFFKLKPQNNVEVNDNTDIPYSPSSSSVDNLNSFNPDISHSPVSNRGNFSRQSFDYSTFIQCKNNELKGFSIFHLNIQSLKAKHELLESLLSEIDNFDLLCFTETWLTINNFQCYNLTGYSHIPSIRNNRNGGTSIFVKSNIQYKIREDIKKDLWIDYVFEIAIIEIKILNNKGLLVACIYRTPNSPMNAFITHLDILLDRSILENKQLVIGGDFNIDLLSKNSNAQDFLTIIETNSFQHLINKPTRQSIQTSTCIDNFIVNNNASVNSSGVIELDLSDHFGIFVDLNIREIKNVNNKRKCFYGRPRSEANNVKFLNVMLNEKWTQIYNSQDTNSKYNNFINIFSENMNMCFPTKKISIKLAKKSPWYTQKLRKLNSIKYSLHKIKKGNTSFKNIYNKFSAFYTKSIKTAKRRYYQELFQKNKNNPRKTWKSLNELAGRNNNTLEKPMQLKDKHLITDPKSVAEHINNHFCNIGTSLGLDNLPPSPSTNEPVNAPTKSFALFPVTETEVINSIMKLKPNKSPGYDDITSELLKLTINHTSKVLQHIFNSSFESGIFPSRMKIAKVIPIYKKGSHLDVNNYRPISLLPVLAKCLENIMFNRLTSYTSKFHLLNTTQFGFQKGKSTTDAIVAFLDKLNGHLDNTNAISILCDLSKAFDCVNHKLLLEKLSCIGIRGTPLKWFQSYLEDRYQYTIITKYTHSQNESLATKIPSELKAVRRGVPQGSILGPLLFNIYINELPKNNTISDFILYADDTNILLSDKNLETLQNKFETVLNSTNTWFRDNQLVLNKEKTLYMPFNNISTFHTNSSLNNIKPTNEAKFLGITISSNLTWDSHILQVASKIKPGIAILYKVRNLIDEAALLQVYHALVQSHISYGILLWGDAPQGRIEILLKLQKKALRIIARKNMRTSCRPLFSKYKILTVPSLYILESACYAKKTILIENQSSENILSIRRTSEIHTHNTRNRNDIFIPNIPKRKRRLDTKFKSSIIYNKLPRTLKEIDSAKKFRIATKHFLLRNTIYKIQELKCDIP